MFCRVVYVSAYSAHVIDHPKSAEFVELMDNWQRKRWVEKWDGSFGKAVVDHEDLTVAHDETERYVSVPAMNSLCKHLSEHERIHCHFETKATPTFVTEPGLI